MKYLLLVVLSFASTYALPTRVVNGTDAAPGEIPYIVSLRSFGSHSCGGSILNSRNVLTAAHCASPGETFLTIQYGVVDISSDDHNSISVSKVIRHEEYNPSLRYANDVAILKLAEDIVLDNFARPVVLPQQNEQPISDGQSLLAGWGYIGNSVLPTRLQKVKLIVYSHEACAKAHGSGISSVYHLCSGVPEGWKGQCNGDSGGPLVADGKQIGSVSWSVKPCAVVGYPGVYARTASYVDWIHEKMAL